MTTTVRLSCCALLVACGVVGCSKPSPAASDEPAAAAGATAAAPTSPGDASAKAKDIFATRCTPCHGATGAGDGVASASLDPHPRNFHDKEWQKSVTDQHIETIIKVGGAGVGKSPAMPGNPDLSDPAVVSALRAMIRAFGA